MLLDYHPSRRSSFDPKYASKHLGYWKSDHEPDLPDPADFVDETWDESERAKVIAHLKGGSEKHAWRGYSSCRMGCTQPMKRYTDLLAGKSEMVETAMLNGTRCLTDGTYTWPSGFAHYVEEHGVKPPLEFIAHVLSTRTNPLAKAQREWKKDSTAIRGAKSFDGGPVNVVVGQGAAWADKVIVSSLSGGDED